MGNIDEGEVEIELRGTVYPLKFNNRTVRMLELSLGYTVGYVCLNYERLVGLDFVCKAVHAGLQYEGSRFSRLSQNRISDLLPARYEDVLAKILEGIAAWRGPEEKKEEGDGDASPPTPVGPT